MGRTFEPSGHHIVYPTSSMSKERNVSLDKWKSSTYAMLGHVITTSGVSVDPDKVAAMVEWQNPQLLRHYMGSLA